MDFIGSKYSYDEKKDSRTKVRDSVFEKLIDLNKYPVFGFITGPLATLMALAQTVVNLVILPFSALAKCAKCINNKSYFYPNYVLYQLQEGLGGMLFGIAVTLPFTSLVSNHCFKDFKKNS